MKTKNTKARSPQLPKSATSVTINMAGVVGLSIAIYYVRINNIEAFKGSLIVLLSIVVPIVLLEYWRLKTFKRESTGLDFTKKTKLILTGCL